MLGSLSVLALLAACAPDHTSALPASTTIEVSLGGCGKGWTAPQGGVQTFRLDNTVDVGMDVLLVERSTGAVLDEVDALGPGTTATMRVRVGRGTYAFRCVPDGSDPITGPAVEVTTGPTTHGRTVLPVSDNDLRQAVVDYRTYVMSGLDALVRATERLSADVHAGDLAAARTSWLSAHLAYERLGAAYGTFGDADGAIDGLPTGLAEGVHDPEFTGFHRIEYGLWHGEAGRSLGPPVERLLHDVRALRAAFPQQRTDPGDLGLRAHEILENTLQFQLTGLADEGSGTTLATAAANLAGTRAVLRALDPVLRDRLAGRPSVQAWLGRTNTLLDAAHQASGWTPVDKLTTARREELSGAMGELLERLAPIAVITEPRRTQ